MCIRDRHITITSSTNMSKEDIDKAVKEAEQFAAEDAKKKEEIDVRNQADQVVYQTEKALEDAKDKISADDKATVEAALNKLKDALKGTDVAAIKAATEEASKAFYPLSLIHICWVFSSSTLDCGGAFCRIATASSIFDKACPKPGRALTFNRAEHKILNIVFIPSMDEVTAPCPYI